MAATAAAAAAGPSRHRGAVGAAPTLHRLAGASSACSRAAAPVGPASPHGARLAIPPPPGLFLRYPLPPAQLHHHKRQQHPLVADL